MLNQLLESPKVEYQKVDPTVFNGSEEMKNHYAKKAHLPQAKINGVFKQLIKTGLLVKDKRNNWYIRTA